MSIKRVFIAGAACQQCGQIDKIQRCKDDASDDYWMECVACGFRQEMPAEPKQEAPQPKRDEQGRPIKFEPLRGPKKKN